MISPHFRGRYQAVSNHLGHSAWVGPNSSNSPTLVRVIFLLIACLGWAMPILIWRLNALGFSAGPAIPYANDSRCDPWYYFGFATLADSAWILSPGTRWGARLSAYLPNFVLGKLLPLNAAERGFLLNHTLSYIGALLTVLPLYGFGIAILCAVLITSSALYISVLSTTYASVSALAYGFLAVACLTRVVVEHDYGKERWLCLLAGLLFAGAALAHLMVAVFLSLLPLVLLIKYDWRSPNLYRDLALIIVGGVLGIALIGCSSLLVGQPFFAFWYQIKAAIQGVGDWFNLAMLKQSVAIPLSLGLSIALLTMFRFRADRLSIIITTIVFGTTIAALAQTFILRSTSLVFDAFFVLFLVPSTLAIAELLRRPAIEPVSATPIIAIIIAYAGLMLLLSASSTLRNAYLANAMVLTCLFSAAVVIAVILRWRALVLATVFLTLQATLGNLSRAHWTLDALVENERAETVTQILNFVNSYGITRQPVIWIGTDADDDLSLAAFRSFARCGFEPTFPEQLPDPKLQWQKPIARGELLILLNSPAMTQQTISTVLGMHSLRLSDVRTESFGREPRQLRVTIGRLD
jgi:hypothetical protein